ncbi:14461_t:CDS:2, partial [Funneliformis caledonium]
SQLIFSDESAYDKRTLSRRYGWNISGFRAKKPSFFVRGKRFTIEGALCVNGLLAYGIQKGSMDACDYEYLLNTFCVLVLDNASIHKGRNLHDLCEEKGIILQFLPPYSPDYNP